MFSLPALRNEVHPVHPYSQDVDLTFGALGKQLHCKLMVFVRNVLRFMVFGVDHSCSRVWMVLKGDTHVSTVRFQHIEGIVQLLWPDLKHSKNMDC